MEKKKKILFINFGGLGDEILFLPTIQSVKEKYPNSEITLALEARSKGILSLTNISLPIPFLNILSLFNSIYSIKNIIAIVSKSLCFTLYPTFIAAIISSPNKIAR